MITSSKQRIAALTEINAWGKQTLHQFLDRHVQERGDAFAISDQPNRDELCGGQVTRLNFRQLGEASDGMAATLLDAGVSTGDILVVQLPNIVELFVCYYAASKLGVIISPVPVQYGRHELSHITSTLGAQALLSCKKFKNTSLADNAAAALPDVQVLCLERELPPLREWENIGLKQRHRVEKYQLENPVSADHILTICWTSGTTGTPKGVPRSHNMWLATARGTAIAGDYQSGDRLLAPFPMVSMAALAGFLFTSALKGCGVVLHHPFDPELFLHQLADEKINFSAAPPAILNKLAKSSELWARYDFSALRAIGSGGAPLAPWMVKKFERDYKLPVINFYGSNEGIGLHSTPASAPSAEARGTMFPRLGIKGLPWEGMRVGVETKVANPDTGEEITAPGVPGELLIAGPTVFDGYFGHDNDGVFSDDNFFRSGDLVEICGEPPLYPYYRIVGRCKDIINRGGMKISPTEIDLVLEDFPGIQEGAVCSYPDERLGEKICACLVVKANGDIPELSSLQDWLLEQGIAKFKLPERIAVFDELPRNPLGKVQRSALTKKILSTYS